MYETQDDEDRKEIPSFMKEPDLGIRGFNSAAYKMALSHQLQVLVDQRNADHYNIDFAKREQMRGEISKLKALGLDLSNYMYVPTFRKEIVVDNIYGYPMQNRSDEFLVPAYSEFELFRLQDLGMSQGIASFAASPAMQNMKNASANINVKLNTLKAKGKK